jgi:hypothetical protein
MLARHQAVTDNAGTNHGWRSTFRSWSAAHGVDREVAELSIAHTVGGVEGRYQRDHMIERRRPVIQAYADHVTRRRERDGCALRGQASIDIGAVRRLDLNTV